MPGVNLKREFKRSTCPKRKEDKIIKTHIFELGYLRPNFVTLENKGINYNSGFIKNRDFYLKQDSYA